MGGGGACLELLARVVVKASFLPHKLHQSDLQKIIHRLAQGVGEAGWGSITAVFNELIRGRPDPETVFFLTSHSYG
jgi:hypothetical protein